MTIKLLSPIFFQVPWPRSPSEKLLDEMFTGCSAKFLAVVESLVEPGCRPLDHAPPRLLTDLDEETLADVYQELFCAGTSLALNQLIGSEEKDRNTDCDSSSLMAFAIQGHSLSTHLMQMFFTLLHVHSSRVTPSFP